MKKISITTILILTLALASHSTRVLFAAVMNSTNYSIESDSVNFGGGQSSSTSYLQESTFGEIATGPSNSTNYNLKAGYQQMQGVFISLSTVADVNLTPSIPSVGGGVGDGSTSVTVTTDSTAGYELYIKASSTPALVSGVNSFADYTPAGVNPDFSFVVPATDSEFAFTPEGIDIAALYKDDGGNCNAGVLDTINACWSPLTTTNSLVSKNITANYPSGTATVLKFRAESGATHVQPVGAYTATTTLTAIAL